MEIFFLSSVILGEFQKHQNPIFEKFSDFFGNTQNEKNPVLAIFLPEYLSLDSSPDRTKSDPGKTRGDLRIWVDHQTQRFVNLETHRRIF